MKITRSWSETTGEESFLLALETSAGSLPEAMVEALNQIKNTALCDGKDVWKAFKAWRDADQIPLSQIEAERDEALKKAAVLHVERDEARAEVDRLRAELAKQGSSAESHSEDHPAAEISCIADYMIDRRAAAVERLQKDHRFNRDDAVRLTLDVSGLIDRAVDIRLRQLRGVNPAYP